MKEPATLQPGEAPSIADEQNGCYLIYRMGIAWLSMGGMGSVSCRYRDAEVGAHDLSPGLVFHDRCEVFAMEILPSQHFFPTPIIIARCVGGLVVAIWRQLRGSGVLANGARTAAV